MVEDVSVFNRFDKKLVVLAILCLCVSSPAGAGLTERIDGIIARSSLKKAKFAVKVVDASTGGVIYERNADVGMIPASNMKIVTSAAALEYLGGGYNFTTKVGLLGKTLVVIGAGDPLFGDKDTDSKYGRKKDWIFEDIIAALKKEGAASIKGIVVDSTFFDDNRVHPNWPRGELNRPHACEISGLNFNTNCVKITVSKAGKAAAVTVEPATGYVKIVNKVKLTSKGNSAVGAYRNTVPNKLIVKGKCRKKAAFDVAIERPAAFFGFLLAEKLAKAGINVEGQLAEKYVKKDTKIKILKIYTTPISDVLTRCNTDSLSLAAEALVKTVSAENTDGRINGEWAHGLSLMSRYLTGLGIDASRFHLDDGGGLSRKNKLSADAITKVLLHVYKGRNRRLYLDSLATGGVNGTIARYFTEKKYKGKIFGKTGYIKDVRTFSGICTAPKGDYIFSILTSGGNNKVRPAINDIAKAIIDYAD